MFFLAIVATILSLIGMYNLVSLDIYDAQKKWESEKYRELLSLDNVFGE